METINQVSENKNNADRSYKDFFIAPILKKGKPALLIRRAVCNKPEIDELLTSILTDGKAEFRIVVSFRDPFSAKVRLKELGLLP